MRNYESSRNPSHRQSPRPSGSARMHSGSRSHRRTEHPRERTYTRTTHASRTHARTSAPNDGSRRTAGSRTTGSRTTGSRATTSNRRSRAIGATTLSAPAANAIGLSGRTAGRAYGRGTTAQRVEEARTQQSVVARPAVYTGESRHAGLLGRLSAWRPSLPEFHIPRLPLPLLLTLIVVFFVAMLAGPARLYYTAWRDAGILEAEYTALSERNAQLADEIDQLTNIEGIEDEARRRGYVYPDEEALVVRDLHERELSDAEVAEEAIAQHEQNLPWYVPVLDRVFGYARS